MPGPVNMEDPQEYKSLDELFRKTFEELPESPAASGWDVPSPRVWEQVQTHIRPPKSGWSTQSLLLVAGMAVVLLLGLYWVLSRPDLPDTNTTPAATEQPATVADISAENTTAETSPTEQPLAVPTRPSVPAPVVRRAEPATPSPALQPDEHVLEEEHATPHRPAGSLPLPGSAQAPNTTIRRQMEELRQAPWAQPLKPLPGVWMKWKEKAVPEAPK